MVEWTDKYNSFNSYKGLTYYENYKQIMKWMDGDPYLPPPVECNLDPFDGCNLRCYFCIGQRYIGKSPKKLPEDYVHKLIDFLAEWGVKGLCISGGGEPSLHPDIERIIEHAVDVMDTALVTNMTKVVYASVGCKWVAMSVDSADKETYMKVKGVDRFNDVVWNIEQLSRRNETSNLCFKFLVLPENQHQIYDACKLAKELGVQHFHARPVDFERGDIEGHRKLNIDTDKVKEQFEKCHELDDKNFKAFTVTHKFNESFHVKHDFEKCLATPLVIPILTDGNAYLCVDKKMGEKFKLGSCTPPEKILEWWGSDGHRDLIKSVNINECSRCTWGSYNQQIENIERMDVSFP